MLLLLGSDMLIVYIILNYEFFNISAEDEDSENEKEARDAVWTVTELEHLLIFLSNAMMMTFPLYILCKHNRICGIEVCYLL